MQPRPRCMFIPFAYQKEEGRCLGEMSFGRQAGGASVQPGFRLPPPPGAYSVLAD